MAKDGVAMLMRLLNNIAPRKPRPSAYGSVWNSERAFQQGRRAHAYKAPRLAVPYRDDPDMAKWWLRGYDYERGQVAIAAAKPGTTAKPHKPKAE